MNPRQNRIVVGVVERPPNEIVEKEQVVKVGEFSEAPIFDDGREEVLKDLFATPDVFALPHDLLQGLEEIESVVAHASLRLKVLFIRVKGHGDQVGANRGAEADKVLLGDVDVMEADVTERDALGVNLSGAVEQLVQNEQ